MIKAWSYSRLVDYEQCPRRAQLKYIDKVPEPERPLPPGKTEHANDRGTRVHEAAEHFVKGKIEFIPELKKFQAEFEGLRKLYSEGKVSLEGEWAFDKDWASVAWMSEDCWSRVKLDVAVDLTKTHAAVIDFKTGKRYGNEVKHAEQGQLYQVAKFMRDPNIQKVEVELWYTDLDHIESFSFTRQYGLKLLKKFHERGEAMTQAVDFPARPSAFTCKWCPYKNNAEVCPEGAR